MSKMPPGCLAFFLVVFFLFFLPFFLADAMLSAFAKLGLSPQTSLLALVGIFLGGAVDVPITRVRHDEPIDVLPVSLFGLDRILVRPVQPRAYTVIAVNLGGCVLPCAIAFYQLARLAALGAVPLLLSLLAIAINVAVCNRLARPLPKVGIALPALVPALVAAACALLFLADLAPPLAFAAGVLGPLIGADLMHLGDVKRISTGVASIGGAGTFDAIVISGFAAVLLA